MNCGSGPDGLLSAVERAVRLTTLPLIVQPNAGMPKEVDNRRIYLCSPEYLTEYAKRYVGLGASAVGGCCGTTPEHIRAIAAAIKPLGADEIETGRSWPRPNRPPTKPPMPLRRKIESRPASGREAMGDERGIGSAARLRSCGRPSKRAARSASAASRRSTFPTAPGRRREFRR